MHRQSLGSPSTKLYSHGGGGGGREDKLDEEERKRKDGAGAEGRPVALEEHNKAEKLHRSAAGVEKSIHLIPILLIFCFLVLYLCSHDPAQKDLADFTGFRRPSKLIDADSTDIDDFRRFLDLDKADALAIRSHRSLHEIGKDARSSRSHRKLADF